MPSETTPATPAMRGLRQISRAELTPDGLAEPTQLLESSPKKRQLVRAACEACRARKSKCNGARPHCSTCLSRNKDCAYSTAEVGETHAQARKRKYDELSRQKVSSERIYEMIQTRPEAEVDEIVRRMRTGVDAESLVRFIETGDLLVQVRLAPNVRRTRFDFPWLSGMPIHLLQANNPYRDSILYQITMVQATAGTGVGEEDRTPGGGGHSLITPSQPEHADDGSRGQWKQTAPPIGCSSTYLMPYPVAEVVEPLIGTMIASRWTPVISDDKLFRRLLLSFFQFPPVCGPYVCKDLFLEDMAAGRTRFCSPLLVHAVLAVACQGCLDVPDRSKMWLHHSMTYRFLAEARRLWDDEAYGRPRITTIQAALILSFLTANNGMDDVGIMYMTRACDMCTALGLFGPERPGTSPEMGRAGLFTAWATFSWQATYNYFYFRPPTCPRPPQIPLPDAQANPAWYGEIWLRYPHDPVLRPLRLGHKLQAEASLYTIMNDFGSLVFGGGGSSSSTSSTSSTSSSSPSSHTYTVGEMVMLKQRLDAWFAALPRHICPKEVVLPFHINLHIPYQLLVISLMEVVMASPHRDDPRIRDVLAGKPPEAIRDEARGMLETVMRLYYARHDFVHYDPWVVAALTALGNMIIADLAADRPAGRAPDPLRRDGLRATLILCAQGLDRQSRHFHVGKLVAIQFQNSMKPEDLSLVHTHAAVALTDEADRVLVNRHSRSLWPVPGVAKIYESAENTRLQDLLGALRDVKMEGDDEPPRRG